MTHHERALWRKIEAFPLDGDAVVLDFTARLARENGWSRGYASEVVREYKRFLFLAVAAGHPVTPSEQVDQAWHLHLVYTKSYWEELCGKVLGRPLHHGPTEGGISEGNRYRRQYAETLASYQRFFGEPAPDTIWPAVEKRFGSAPARWVDPAATWMIPKPAWWPRGGAFPRWRPLATLNAMAFLMAFSLLAGCVHQWNVLDWKGHEFLAFYVLMVPPALLFSLVAVKWAKGNARPEPTLPTDPCLIAFLAGGGGRAFDTAMAALFAAGKIRLAGGQEIQRVEENEADAPGAFEAKVLNAIPREGSAPARSVLQSLKPAIEELRQQAQDLGWVWPPGRRLRLQFLAALPFLFLLATGVAKFVVGSSRDKPVFFLVLLMFAVFMVMIFRISGVARRTPTGQAVWKRLRKCFPRPRRNIKPPAGTPEGNPRLATLVAVHGLGVAGLLGIEGLRPVLMAGRMDSSGSGGCGSGCGSGGDSGCGGGGCGGCGGD